MNADTQGWVALIVVIVAFLNVAHGVVRSVLRRRAGGGGASACAGCGQCGFAEKVARPVTPARSVPQPTPLLTLDLHRRSPSGNR